MTFSISDACSKIMWWEIKFIWLVYIERTYASWIFKKTGKLREVIYLGINQKRFCLLFSEIPSYGYRIRLTVDVKNKCWVQIRTPCIHFLLKYTVQSEVENCWRKENKILSKWKISSSRSYPARWIACSVFYSRDFIVKILYITTVYFSRAEIINRWLVHWMNSRYSCQYHLRFCDRMAIWSDKC